MNAETFKRRTNEDNSFQLVKAEMGDRETIDHPEIVYKYRCWHNQQSTFHDNILLNNEIYIPSPDEFVDKMDCRNPTRYDILTHDERITLCQRILKSIHSKYNEATILRLAKIDAESPRLKDKSWMDEVDRRAWGDYNRFTGIFSVTDSSLNAKLWKVYGDNYKGICYGFDTAAIIEDVGFGGGGLVHYVDELSIIHPLDEFPIMFFKRVFCKTKEWEFEREYRLKTADYQPRIRQFQESTLKEIIIGHEMAEECIPEIIANLNLRQHRTQLFQTVVSGRGLTRKEIKY